MVWGGGGGVVFLLIIILFQVEIHDEEFAERVWQRIKHLVPECVTITDDDRRYERDIAGTWVPVGVNHVLLFARYAGCGHFSPHTDGYTIVDFNHRSLYSLLVYLNTCEQGGATRLLAYDDARSQKFIRDSNDRFRWPEERVLDIAAVVTGSALAFYQVRDLKMGGHGVG